jgi:glucose/mannose-6-phosphate isomerase
LLVTRGTLDDRGSIEAADKSGMLSLAAGLGRQLSAGYAAGVEAAGEVPEGGPFDSIVVCGMGGSGVAGDVVRSLYSNELSIPVVSLKGYVLPAFVGVRGQTCSLVLAVSYSGDTEETLALYEQARNRGATVVTISSGGELAARSMAHAVRHVSVPNDVPTPRVALGYLSGAALGVLQSLGLVASPRRDVERTAELLSDLAERLGPERALSDNEAKALALWLAGRIPVVWGSEGLAEGAVLRWKNQLNENAKVPAFASLLPELDHNEIEGWRPGAGLPFGLVVLRHGAEDPRVASRVSASLDAVSDSGLAMREVWAEGSSPLESLFSLMMKADFASIYLAVVRGVDPTPVPVLTGLKKRLRP